MAHAKRMIPLLFLALAACRGAGEDRAVGTSELTGVYLGAGEGRQQDRICMIEVPQGDVRFGIVTLEPDRAACSGLGRVERSGANLQLIMEGEEPCVVPGTLNGTRVVLASVVPESCNYYCGPTASLAGKAFRKTEDTTEAALLAADLVGNSLCG